MLIVTKNNAVLMEFKLDAYGIDCTILTLSFKCVYMHILLYIYCTFVFKYL